jgi:hypothetical protein
MRQALTGNHKEDFWDAMDKEIHSLETMDTWPMERKDLPVDSRVIPGAWIWIKRFPDGRLNKFKARFCVRGDSHGKGSRLQ